MGRNPCCEKMGLKKGPWTSEEDAILVNFINNYGHDNWRALPKQAGLMRCGKSCRLRWMNYLRPDIKRGNFTREEEETIMRLHQELGNKWSVIAAKLPGRTDNEIKNVWHTSLKKKLNKTSKPEPETLIQSLEYVGQALDPNSPQHSSSEGSSAYTESANNVGDDITDLLRDLPEMDESFWSDGFSSGNSDNSIQFEMDSMFGPDNKDFFGGIDNIWDNLFSNDHQLIQLPEFW